MSDPFDIITEFENKVAKFFDAPYAVAVDSCTHGLELCIRYMNPSVITVPNRTYLSVAFLPLKLNKKFGWDVSEWQDYYHLTPNIIDAAVYWKKDGYIPNTMMCLSFQYQKHLKLGRGGMILLDNEKAKENLTKMAYDGRTRGIPWRDQNINTIGYHYYMTPEVAQLGLDKLQEAIQTEPRKWDWHDWPDLREMEIFK